MGDGGKGNHKRDDDDIGMFENYSVPRRPQSNRLAGWRVVSLFLFFFLISGHERSERKGPSIPQATHARPFIFLFLLLFCPPRFFTNMGRKAGGFWLVTLFLVDWLVWSVQVFTLNSTEDVRTAVASFGVVVVLLLLITSTFFYFFLTQLYLYLYLHLHFFLLRLLLVDRPNASLAGPRSGARTRYGMRGTRMVGGTDDQRSLLWTWKTDELKRVMIS